jgi:hypothetical protein
MAYDDALASLRTMLDADGYALTVRKGPTGLVAEIRAGPDACADCLVQKDLMRLYIEQALRPVVPGELPAIDILYPADLA